VNLANAYCHQLIAVGLHPETAERAAQILTQRQRSAEDQEFIAEIWALLCPMLPLARP